MLLSLILFILRCMSRISAILVAMFDDEWEAIGDLYADFAAIIIKLCERGHGDNRYLQEWSALIHESQIYAQATREAIVGPQWLN